MIHASNVLPSTPHPTPLHSVLEQTPFFQATDWQVNGDKWTVNIVWATDPVSLQCEWKCIIMSASFQTTRQHQQPKQDE